MTFWRQFDYFLFFQHVPAGRICLPSSLAKTFCISSHLCPISLFTISPTVMSCSIHKNYVISFIFCLVFMVFLSLSPLAMCCYFLNKFMFLASFLNPGSLRIISCVPFVLWTTKGWFQGLETQMFYSMYLCFHYLLQDNSFHFTGSHLCISYHWSHWSES